MSAWPSWCTCPGARSRTAWSCRRIAFNADYLTVVVAILGTTISPYLFFWQAEEEVEDVQGATGRQAAGTRARAGAGEFRRIRIDTYLGMGLSNLVALFIIITTAATLNAHGVTDIQTSSQAAEALRPDRRPVRVPDLRPGHHRHRPAGPAGAGRLGRLCAGRGLRLACRARPQARTGQGASTARSPPPPLVGAVLNFTPIDPIKALFWSAVINGVVAVPVMVITMRLASNPAVMGRFTIPPVLKTVGWLATAVMTAAAIGMLATWSV